jgi:hypothetical protein
MANTTNFNWETPDDTDLVKDGALAIRTLGNSIDTSFVDLKGGTTGQILSKASNTDLDYTWINNDTGDITGVTAGTGISGGGTSGTVTITNSMATEITAAGDIIVGTGSGTFDNLPIGTTGQVLTADTTVSPYKVKWATAASGSTFAGCRLFQSSDQSLSSSTSTLLTFGSESFDTDNFHSTSSNTGRITIPSGKAGKYLFVATVRFADNNTGTRQFWFYLNGGGTYAPLVMTQNTATTNRWVGTASMIYDMAVGDYMELYAWQNSGGSLTTTSGTDNTTFSCAYLGA